MGTLTANMTFLRRGNAQVKLNLAVLAATSLIVLTACGHAGPVAQQSSHSNEFQSDMMSSCGPAVVRGSAEVRLVGETLYYRGPMNSNANDRLFSLYEEAESKPTSLVVTSGGGDICLGMQLGEWVHANKLDVKIPSRCFSACANYILTAGNSVELGADAQIGWHGSPIFDDLIEGTPAGATRWERVQASLMESGLEQHQIEAYWHDIRLRNRRFFSRVKVNPLITVPSLLSDENTQVLTSAHKGNSDSALYYLTLEDMAELGLDVSVIDGARWNPPVESNLIRVALLEGIETYLKLVAYQLEKFPH